VSIGSIVIWIAVGAIAGILAKLIMPGYDPGGIIVTFLIGIAGAFVSGFLTSLIGLGQGGLIWTIIVATIGAIILLVIYRLLVGGRVGMPTLLVDELLDARDALIHGRPYRYERQEALKDRDTTASFLDIGQILATYIGIPVVLLYPVGFLVFVLQISRFYPFDFSTAWYAASLIPATVVTGQGVKYLLLPLLISVLISSFVARVFIVSYEQDRRLLSALGLGILLSVLVLPLGIIVFALIAGREGLLYWAFFIPLGALFGLIGARHILNSYYQHQYSADDKQRQGAPDFLPGFLDWFSRGVRERWIFKGLLTAYAGSVISAFLIVFPLDWLDKDPDLPHVKMKTSGRVIEDGILLSHSDGYWHVIDTSRVDADPSIERQSLVISPGKDVSYVRVYESPLQKADIDLALVPPDSPWVSKYLTYTVKVINNGPDTATGIELTNDLPDNEVEFVSASRGQEGRNCSPEVNAGAEKNVITCTVGKLDRDDSTEIHIKVRPEAEATAQNPYTFKADVNSAQRDPDPIDEKAKGVEVKIDREQPETENLSTEANANRWYKEDVTIKLDAEDNKSGVKEITYSATGEQPISKTTYDPERPPVITKQGVTEVHYYAEDIAGNIEPAESFTVRLDKTSPSVTIDSGPEGPTKDSTTSFGFSSDESGSTFECRRDDATFGACDPPQTYDNLADGGTYVSGEGQG
jgi:uncharacterized repeat protein (TIGR01451 family)